MDDDTDTDFGMSSNISFPSAHDDGQFYSAEFDTSASFTMNPLSNHPPRTPHASITHRPIASAANRKRESVISAATAPSTYGGDEKRRSVYEEPPESDESVDGDSPAAQAAKSSVLVEEIWRDMFLSSNGRDKAFKLIQYSLRVILLMNRRIGILGVLKDRFEKTASGLSFTRFVFLYEYRIRTNARHRKLLLLFNWLNPLTTVLRLRLPSSPSPISPFSPKPSALPKPFLHTLLHAPPPVLLELANAFSDDLYAYSLLGLLPKRLGDRAARMSNWCWFFSTLVGLVENAVERSVVDEVEGRMYQDEMGSGDIANLKISSGGKKLDEKEVKRLNRKDYWLQVTRAKLICDLIFVSYDIWRIQRGKDVVKTFAGLGAAVLSSAKLFDKHRSILASRA